MTRKPNESEKACAAWLLHPLVIEASAKIAETGTISILNSLLMATFIEGAKYATQRCDDAGHRSGSRG